MKITINLATRPFADIGPMMKNLRIAMAALAVVSLGLGLGLYFLHNKAEAARARDHSLDGDIARITHERQGYETMMRQPDNAQVLTEAGNLNRLFDEKSFSWTLGMEDLETVLPGGVQVTTLEPIRDKTGRITLRLRVVGPRDRVISMVQNLEHSRHFLQSRIVGESSETTGMPGERLEPVAATNKFSFEVLADYNPAIQEAKVAADKKAADEAAAAKATATAKTAEIAPHAPVAHTATPGLRKPTVAGAGQMPMAGATRAPMAGPTGAPLTGMARPPAGSAQHAPATGATRSPFVAAPRPRQTAPTPPLPAKPRAGGPQ
jgi:type IV pilus assembly protein PilN